MTVEDVMSLRNSELLYRFEQMVALDAKSEDDAHLVRKVEYRVEIRRRMMRGHELEELLHDLSG